MNGENVTIQTILATKKELQFNNCYSPKYYMTLNSYNVEVNIKKKKEKYSENLPFPISHFESF